MRIGGSGLKDDDSLRLSADITTKNLVCWDAIKIDSPFKDKVSGIEIISNAGDVIKCVVTYYDYSDGGSVPKYWSEEYCIDELKLSLKSKSRVCYCEWFPDLCEEKRNKVLEVKT